MKKTNIYLKLLITTASKKGEPFDKLIDKHQMLPNPLARFCTGSLKGILSVNI